MQGKGIISRKLKKDLIWLWGIRLNVHIYLVPDAEYEKYDLNMYRKANTTATSLLKALIKFHDK